MILPEPRNDLRRQRLTAVAGSLALMIGLHAGLRGTPLPAFGSSRAVIRELNPLFVERYAAPPPSAVEEESPVEEDITSVEPTVAQLEEEVGMALGDLVRRFQGDGSGTIATDRSRNGLEQDAMAGISSDLQGGRFAEVFGTAEDAATPVAANPRAPVARGARGRGGIGIETTLRREGAGNRDPAAAAGGREGAAARDLSGGAGADVDVSVAARRERASAQVTEVVISEHQPESFGRSEGDALADWMRAHPAELPVGVKVHLNYLPSFLTASLPLASAGRELELFLMFNPTLQELHIMLVEGNRSVYLIDRGFQEESRSLREGIVSRLDGEIVAVDSRAGAPSSDRAREFYNIFLSWWELARGHVRR